MGECLICHERPVANAPDAAACGVCMLADLRRIMSEHKAAEARADAAEAKAAQYERDWYAAKNDFGTAMAKSREALAAARRECEGLLAMLTEARAWVHQLYRMQDCHAETAPEAKKILRTLKRIDAALDAPAAGEEGER